MIHVIHTLNDMYKGKIPNPVGVGIGVNSGEVVAGNLGTHARLVYTVTGDTVNTGKRIEQLTKKHTNSVLISEGVREKLDPSIQCEAWDPVKVKGKAEPLKIYRVMP